MSTDENKQVVRAFIARVLVQGDKSAVDELVADDFVSHGWPAEPDSKTGLKNAADRVHGALTEVAFDVDDLIAEDDRVVARVTSRGRQVGQFMGMPPSGKSYSVGEIHIFRVRDGKIVEHWFEMDAMGMMQQLKGAETAQA